MGFISDSLGLIGNIFYRASDVAAGVTGMLKVDARPWESLYGKATGRDYEKLVKRYTSWVYACATKNATSCAQVPLRLYGKKTSSRTKFIVPTKSVSKEHKDYLFKQPQLRTKLSNAVDVEEIMEHPFLDLLVNVNPYMNGIDLMELWVLYQELTGNAYTYIVKNNLGTPEQLWIVPPIKMKIIPDLEMFIKAYVYGTDPQKRIVFEPDEIIHMKYPNPHSLYYGFGPLAAASLAADTGQAMSAYEYNLLMNDAIPRSALVTERVLQQGQVDNLKKEWNAHYRGVKKAGKLAILAGGLRVDKISMTPKEMGFLVGRKVSREEVAAIFSVPMSKLSVEDIKKAPAGGMFHGNIMYQRDTILPKLRKIEAKLNEKLLPMYDDKLFCAFDNPVGEDKEFRLKERDANIKNGYSSINEERLRDNQEPVEWGEVPWLASGLVQTDAERSLSPSLSGGAGDGNSAPSPSDDGKGHKYIDPDDLPSERKALARIVKRMFRLQAQEVLGNMPRGSRSVEKSVEEFWLPHERKWTGWLAEESTPEMIKLTKKGAEHGAKKLAVSVGVQVNAPEVAEFAKRHAYKFSFAVNQETMDILRTNMAEGLQAGENMYQIRKRVQTTFDDMSNYRSERIARTESARAVNAGMENGWQQSGVVEGKEWDGASDMCEFCQAMNAKYGPGTGGIPLGNTFVNQGEGVTGIAGGNLSTDYGPVEYPPIHPHCRCDLLPVVKDEGSMPDGAEVKPEQSFDESDIGRKYDWGEEQFNANPRAVGSVAKWEKRTTKYREALKQHIGMDFAATKRMTKAQRKAAANKLHNKLKEFTRPSTENTVQARQAMTHRGSASMEKRLKREVNEFFDVVDGYGCDGVKKMFNGKGIEVWGRDEVGRAHARTGFMQINLYAGNSSSVTFHEAGHLISHAESAKRKGKLWAKKRAKESGYPRQMMYKDIRPNTVDRASRAYKDDFIDTYTGKLYRDGDTEVFSMGVQQFQSKEKLLLFAEKDFDHFSFIHGTLTGAF